jgi:hypothetical protein
MLHASCIEYDCLLAEREEALYLYKINIPGVAVWDC